MNIHSADSAKQLLQRLRDGTLTEAEELMLLRWLNQYQQRPDQQVTDESLEAATAVLKERLDGYVIQSNRRRITRNRYWVAACIAFLVVVLGGYLLVPDLRPVSDELGSHHDHEPGRDQAVLVLEDGREIVLGGQTTDVIDAAGYEVKQFADSGIVIYLSDLSDAIGSDSGGEIPTNTLQTPRGGQYRLVLPDGSQVWLNSDSRITYPVRFAELREVQVTGEAYFQVRQDGQKPFIVHAGMQRIDVLGTEFNVNAYPDQSFTETVLVSGSLKASSSVYPHTVSQILQPGQYARVDEAHSIKAGTANVAKMTAWRHGDFFFEDETLPEIMDMLARWYDVDVVYKADLSDKGKFGGVISRDKKLSAVLQMLESTGKVKFKITEKEVVLMD